MSGDVIAAGIGAGGAVAKARREAAISRIGSSVCLGHQHVAPVGGGSQRWASMPLRAPNP